MWTNYYGGCVVCVYILWSPWWWLISSRNICRGIYDDKIVVHVLVKTEAIISGLNSYRVHEMRELEELHTGKGLNVARLYFVRHVEKKNYTRIFPTHCRNWKQVFFNGSTAPWGPKPPHFSRLHDHFLDTPHSVGLLWTSDQPVAETSTWQHTTLTRDRHPCHRRDWNPQSQ
jgi:hypothetical protein